MFDIGFSELMVIAIVALVVIGPERLPRVARTAGHMLGRLQRYVSTVKSDINREMQLEELRRLQSEIQESARGVEQSLTSEIEAAKQAVSQAAEAASGDLHAPLSGAEPGVAPLAAPAAAPPLAASSPARLVDPDKPGAGA